ncbi:DNA primase [Candidatus Gracilibacteria bacterium]|nr:DNA primase [Candidatus Gracilibacteria bacterium]
MLDPIVEIKAKLPIEELVKDYVQLKRAGRNFKGLCPFHQEKTPSFIVSPDKGLAYCFGCHQGGDIFKFYMTVEKVEFGDAIHDLAERVGVMLDTTKMPAISVSKDEKERLRHLLKQAQEFFREQGKVAPKAQQYLEKRTLSAQTAQTFGIGYAPEAWQQLTDYLISQKFTNAELVNAGVSIIDEKNPSHSHDKFRDRIMFPFYGDRGEIIGFTGRALTEENIPKYLNSPETILFHKSAFIYGLYQAKTAIRESKTAIVVEGQVDCLSCVQHGLTNTVAVSGTAFTAKHLEILRRQVETLLFVFDGDNAGKQAALRIMPEVVALPETKARFVLLPDQQDPDSMLQQDEAAFRSLLMTALDWLSFIIQAFFPQADWNDVEQQKSLLKLTIPLIKRLPHPFDQDTAITTLAKLINKPAQLIYKTLRTYKIDAVASTVKPLQSTSDPLLYTLAFYAHFHQFIDDLNDPSLLQLLPEPWTNIYRITYQYYSAPRVSSDISSLLLQFPPAFSADSFSLQLLRIDEDYQSYDIDRLTTEKHKLLTRLKTHLKQASLRSIQTELKKAQIEDNQELIKKLLADTNRLLQLHT